MEEDHIEEAEEPETSVGAVTVHDSICEIPNFAFRKVSMPTMGLALEVLHTIKVE